ncbi:MAG: molybdenum ABC transporter ATP-binding protein [Pseudomonadota bacterium]
MTLSVRLRQSYGDFRLQADFDAPPGVTVLFGRSGSGKSTIINAIAGVITPDEGRITIDDWCLFDTAPRRVLPPHRRRLGVIFQEGRLFPHLSVAQNLRYGELFGRSKISRQDRSRVIEMLGIGPLLSRRPGALSGGEKQRVAIGRALLRDPRLILADEPLASLDEARKAEILPYFERLRDETDVPILYVSHSPTEVARLATTIIALEAGKIIRQGPAVEVLADPMVTPTGMRAAGAVLEARIKTHHADGLTEIDAQGAALFLPRIAQTPGTPLRVRIPARDVMLSTLPPEGLSALNVLPGRITHLRPGDGPDLLVSLSTQAGTVLSRITGRSAERMGLAVGRELHAIIKTIAIAPEEIGAGALSE